MVDGEKGGERGKGLGFWGKRRSGERFGEFALLELRR